MSLVEKLSEISANLTKQKQLLLGENEEAAIRVSILPFIEALGFDIRNLAEVKSEVTADARRKGRKRTDYEIYLDGEPILVIEAKPAHNVLTEDDWDQLKGYYNDIEVRFGILTNGLEYRFYTDLKKDNVMDIEPFLTINMLSLDNRLVSELEGFTKADFDAQRIIAGAQRQVIVRLLQQEMDRPSDELVKHFAEQVYSGNVNARVIQKFAPVVEQAWRELVERNVVSRLKTRDESGQSQTDAKKMSSRPKPPPPPPPDVVQVPIYGELKKGKYAGHRFEATLLVSEGIDFKQKIIRFHGELMTPSGAVKLGFQKAIGEKPSTNGWWFWKVTDPATGQERPIDKVVLDKDLRGRLMNK